MNTNHNRIKVSDLETDDPDKILATNSKGELEFIATKNIKVDSYNALDYDQEGKALDARQGKILKDLVNNKTDKGGFQGTAQDLANSIPDLNSSNLKLGNYPSTRNDGQLSTNKVLSTDASGNLKLYSLPISSIYPAPYLTEILPYNFLPNTTGNIVLKGSFFTPTMTVEITGQIVHSMRFISDNEVHVSVTTGSEEGSFGVTLNNGLSVTFPDALLIVLGDVYKPTASDWIDVLAPLDTSKGDEVNIGVWNSYTTGILSKEFDYTKNFRVRFCIKKSPLGNPNDVSNEYQHPHIQFIDSTNSVLFFCTVNTATIYDYVGVYGIPKYGRQADWDWGSFLYNAGNNNEWWNTQSEESVIEIRHTEGILYAFCDNVLKFRFDVVLTENIRMKVDLKSFDISKITYIETT
jgi:hypothetical protein